MASIVKKMAKHRTAWIVGLAAAGAAAVGAAVLLTRSSSTASTTPSAPVTGKQVNVPSNTGPATATGPNSSTPTPAVANAQNVVAPTGSTQTAQKVDGGNLVVETQFPVVLVDPSPAISGTPTLSGNQAIITLSGTAGQINIYGSSIPAVFTAPKVTVNVS